MAVEIKSGNSSDLATVETTSKSIRVTNFSTAGIEGFQSLPISVPLTDVTALNDDLLAALDVSQYKFISLQLTGTWAATVSFQGSNDGGTFFPIVTSNPSGGQAVGETSTTENRLVKVPTIYKFVRIRVTAYTSGIVEGVAYGHRDENSSGLIAAIGPVTLNPETTKVIGTVNLAAETTKVIGTVNLASDGVQTYEQVISAATTNQTLINAGATKLKTFSLVNGVATLRYFKFFNKATAPVVGSDTPFLTITMAPNSESRFTLPNGGIDFSVGMGYAITLGPASDNTTPDSVVAAVTGIIGYV
jgi:hypothetical protein